MHSGPKDLASALDEFKRLLEGDLAFDEDAADLVSDDDSRWFEAHPHRSYRIRAHVAIECPVDPDSPQPSATLVVQVVPGRRFRIPLYGGPPFDPGEDCLREAARNSPVAPYRIGEQPITLEDLRQSLAELPA